MNKYSICGSTAPQGYQDASSRDNRMCIPSTTRISALSDVSQKLGMGLVPDHIAENPEDEIHQHRTGTKAIIMQAGHSQRTGVFHQAYKTQSPTPA